MLRDLPPDLRYRWARGEFGPEGLYQLGLFDEMRPRPVRTGVTQVKPKEQRPNPGHKKH
jgi:hypothetical protein